MTPKEKAGQLVYEMYHVDVVNLSEYGMEWNMAKQCALIAVDEIISDNASIYSQQYWNEVKQEINKL